jgi:hypothetical protein
MSYSSRFTELLHRLLSHDIFSGTEQHIYNHKAHRMCLDNTKPVVTMTKIGILDKDWAKYSNEGIHNFHSWQTSLWDVQISDADVVAQHISCMEEMRNTFEILVWKPWRKSPVIWKI